MSNEYKDWLWDAAQEYVLENESIETLDYYTKWEDGYLALCTNIYENKVMYFIWLDDITGWSYKLIEV